MLPHIRVTPCHTGGHVDHRCARTDCLCRELLHFTLAWCKEGFSRWASRGVGRFFSLGSCFWVRRGLDEAIPTRPAVLCRLIPLCPCLVATRLQCVSAERWKGSMWSHQTQDSIWSRHGSMRLLWHDIDKGRLWFSQTKHHTSGQHSLPPSTWTLAPRRATNWSPGAILLSSVARAETQE